MTAAKKNFVEELRWRGMLHDIMPGTEELLQKEVSGGYIGFDPTADSLHIGHLVQIMTLVHFQKCGHKPFALVGGATGMVGDPSGKSAERNLLNAEEIAHNVSCVKKQLEKFLDFDCGELSAEMVNNYDWFKDMYFLDFIRDVGKHISINYMMAKDSVKNRLESGLSFTEFSYQLVQGYDFYHLHAERGVNVQLGGSDQWGNIVTGTELIRRKAGSEAFAVTTKLITKADGSKFGKTEGGNVWLDPEKTSPYAFYQFWVNCSDADVVNFIRIFSLKDKETIESLTEQHREAPHLRILQTALAEELTERVHSKEDLLNVQKASQILFGKGQESGIEELPEKLLLEIMESVPAFEISMELVKSGVDPVEVLQGDAPVFTSKSEARKMIAAGALQINKQKVNAERVITGDDLLHGKYILIQKGKKNYFLLRAV